MLATNDRWRTGCFPAKSANQTKYGAALCVMLLQGAQLPYPYAVRYLFQTVASENQWTANNSHSGGPGAVAPTAAAAPAPPPERDRTLATVNKLHMANWIYGCFPTKSASQTKYGAVLCVMLLLLQLQGAQLP